MLPYGGSEPRQRGCLACYEFAPPVRSDLVLRATVNGPLIQTLILLTRQWSRPWLVRVRTCLTALALGARLKRRVHCPRGRRHLAIGICCWTGSIVAILLNLVLNIGNRFDRRVSSVSRTALPEVEF